jgi:hypothetical protein
MTGWRDWEREGSSIHLSSKIVFISLTLHLHIFFFDDVSLVKSAMCCLWVSTLVDFKFSNSTHHS